MKERDENHQSELRSMDKEKTRREHEYLEKTKDLQSQHDREIKDLQAEMREKLARADQ